MKKLRKIITIVVGLLLFVVVAGVLFVSRLQGHNVVTPTRRLAKETPADYDISVWENIEYTSSDGLGLHAYFVPPAAETNGATVIFVHGLTGNRASMLEQAALLTERGYGAMLIELRGHGESDGEYTTLGYEEIQDVEGAIDYLQTRPEVNADQLGIVGQSLGCITSLRSTARFPEIDVLVAQSCLTSVRDNVEDGVRTLANLPAFPFAPLVVFFGSQKSGVDIDQVRPIDDIDDISPRPILLIHGTEDTLMRVSNAEALFAAAKEPKELYIIEGAGHHPLYDVEPEIFEERFLGFFAEHLPNR